MTRRHPPHDSFESPAPAPADAPSAPDMAAPDMAGAAGERRRRTTRRVIITPLADPVHLKRRAAIDSVLFALFLAGAGFLLPASAAGIAVFLALAGTGILLFLARRNADFTRLAAEKLALERETDGLGIPLSAWHKGETLPPWDERRQKSDSFATSRSATESTRATDRESL